MKNISLLAVLCTLTFCAFSQTAFRSNFKADLDTQFDKGSAITSIPLRKTNDMIVVGKVWGFVKYYHPALYTGDVNLDYELFRILPKILQCNSDQERNKILVTWIKQLGAINPERSKQPDSAGVKLYPDVKWIDEVSLLGDQLSTLLNDIKNASRTRECYYVGRQKAGNPDFKHEKAYDDMHFPDAGFRLLALYRYWNMIQYFFPYKYLIQENWHNVLAEFIPKFVNAATELDYKMTALALIARVHDTHAGMYDQMLEKHRGNYYAPLEITFVENKAVVTDFLHKELGPKTGLQKGDIIISVNGKNTESIVKENLPFMPASNYPAQLRNFSSQLLRSGDTVINITYQHANTLHTTTLTCYPNNNLVRKYESQDTCFRYVAPDIAYIYPGIIKRDYLSKVMPDFMKTKGMIIDLRCYPKENIIYEMAKYLLPEPARFVKFSVANTETPGLFTFIESPAVGTKNPSYYKGRIVIIVNEITQSHAEFTAMSLQTAPRATVIGSTTAGADGNVSRIVLPGGIRTRISGIGVYYPNGKETQRVGIMPDLIVKPTIQGIIQNRDELLEKAIEIINEK